MQEKKLKDAVLYMKCDIVSLCRQASRFCASCTGLAGRHRRRANLLFARGGAERGGF